MDQESKNETNPNPVDSVELSGEEAYVPSPEDFLPTPRPQLTAFERMPRQGSVFPGAVFVTLMTVFSIVRWQFPDRFEDLDITRQSILVSHQYWRMLTAIFVHGDLGHLLHNVPVYLFFAWILQGYFGLLASVVLPLIIGILSNGMTVYFYDDHVHLLGASGMIYGMVALWLMLYIHFDRKSWWVKRVGRAVGFSLLVMFPQTYEPKVSYLAHFTGFSCGLLLGWVFIPVIRRWAPVDFYEFARVKEDEQ